ncbi:MAG TPA: carbohydrate-binding family 9-like protein [Candidatus Hydrogenedentes bacterium]|nr:carbohydrate-binding family 9-like protein [Candidatus Hydrogenedentota bacterium]
MRIAASRHIRRKILWLNVFSLLLAFAGCRSLPTLNVPMCQVAPVIDGKLDDPCFQNTPAYQAFVVAGNPSKKAAPTKAWVFWNSENFIIAFDCQDDTLIAKPPTSNERDVDFQDRVELFIWSGNPKDTYYCMEMAALGAVHDYSCRFYRQFDSTWSVPGWHCAMTQTPRGYQVEAAISREALRQCGFALKPGRQFRAGLFRADFSSANTNLEPDWITWVDAPVPKPDFHIAESFGQFRLSRDNLTECR